VKIIAKRCENDFFLKAKNEKWLQTQKECNAICVSKEVQPDCSRYRHSTVVPNGFNLQVALCKNGKKHPLIY
jgi:hypothetical protein